MPSASAYIPRARAEHDAGKGSPRAPRGAPSRSCVGYGASALMPTPCAAGSAESHTHPFTTGPALLEREARKVTSHERAAPRAAPVDDTNTYPNFTVHQFYGLRRLGRCPAPLPPVGAAENGSFRLVHAAPRRRPLRAARASRHVAAIARGERHRAADGIRSVFVAGFDQGFVVGGAERWVGASFCRMRRCPTTMKGKRWWSRWADRSPRPRRGSSRCQPASPLRHSDNSASRERRR
jgi:hypothetical protein